MIFFGLHLDEKLKKVDNNSKNHLSLGGKLKVRSF